SLIAAQSGPAGTTREEVRRFCECFVIEIALPTATLDLDAYFGEGDRSFRLNVTVAQCEVLRG
ncbi:MAG: hypothetical protein PSV24_09170, partial [Rhodoferax sp.]|nr:hypothetical protein [Rhodoferax sp.]